MKKGLLSLAAVALLATGSFAQEERAADVNWAKYVDDYSVNNETEKLSSISNMEARFASWSTDKAERYALSASTDDDGAPTVKIAYKNISADPNYNVVQCSWAQWKHGDIPKLGDPATKAVAAPDKRDTLIGYSLDVETEPYIEFDYKITMVNDPAEEQNVNIRTDFRDVNGHLGNSQPLCTELATLGSWAKASIEVNGTEDGELVDRYNSMWWDLPFGRYASDTSWIHDADGEIVWLTDGDDIDVDYSQTVELVITLDEGDKAKVNEGKEFTIEFKNFTVGAADGGMTLQEVFGEGQSSIASPTVEYTKVGNTIVTDEEITVISTMGSVLAEGTGEVVVPADGVIIIKSGDVVTKDIIIE